MKPTIVQYRGQPVELVALCRRFDIKVSTAAARIAAGRSVEEAVETPADKRFGRGGRKSPDVPRPCPVMRPKNGRAYCRWSDRGKPREKWFGAWGSAEAREKYARWSAEWAAGGGRPADKAGSRITVTRLIRRFSEWARAEGYTKHGKPTSEYYLYRAATGRWNELYGETFADEFRPSMFRAVRAAWVDRDKLTRRTCNRYAAKLIRVLSWGVSRELVAAAVLAPLREVEPLRAGKTTAPDRPRRKSASPAAVEKVIADIHPEPARAVVLGAMLRVQLLTGMRPGEVCAMRPEFVDRSALPWVYDVGAANKMLHLDRPRLVFFGPRARSILGPVLDAAKPGQPLWLLPPLRGKWVPVRRGEFCRWVKKACRRAGVAPFTPHALRHTRASEVHRLYESDAAAGAAIGDTPEVARAVYVDETDAAARRIAEATG